MNSRTIRVLKLGMVLSNWSSVTAFRLSLAVAAVAAGWAVAEEVFCSLVGSAAAPLAAVGAVVVDAPQAIKTTAISAVMPSIRNLLVVGIMVIRSFPVDEYLTHMRAVPWCLALRDMML